MMKVFFSFVATICFVTIAMYDFLGICRVLSKEKIVEKLWIKIFPNKKYNETIVFTVVRPILLYISMFSFIIVGNVVKFGVIATFLIRVSPFLALGCLLKNIK